MNQHTVLVADNNPDEVSLVQTLLQGAGYNVLVAHEGTETVGLASQAQPDVVLLDVDFGDRELSGDEILEQLKVRRVPTRVVMLTGLREEEDFVKYMRLGAADYLAKPVDRKRMLAAIKRAILVAPTLDIAFGEPALVTQKLLADIHQLKGQIAHLEQRLQEMGVRKADRTRAAEENERLEKENSWLREENTNLTEALRAGRAAERNASNRDHLSSLGIKSAYIALALVSTFLLAEYVDLPKGIAAGILAVVMLVILILPLERATRFSAKTPKGEAHVEMPKP
jgi:DNA-binding response OmpR family regulator